MKKITITFCSALLLFACNDSADKTLIKGTTDSSARAATPLDSATMMKNWEAYMTPGKEHQMIAASDGHWTGEMQMWMAPGGEPSKTTISTDNSMLLGGRYQHGYHKGNVMGQPFEGMSTLAFDNARKVYVSTWIDNMGTGIMIMEGTWDEATKTMNLKGTTTDCNTGKNTDVRETFKIVDNNKQVMEMFGVGPDGKEFKTMQINYTRK
jgi:hypothetical protein